MVLIFERKGSALGDECVAGGGTPLSGARRKIRIGTIPYELRGFMGLRNFYGYGRRRAAGGSKFGLVSDQSQKGVPVRVLPEMVEKYDVKERLQMDYAPRKIAVPQGGIRQEPFRVERQHLDGNHHVNNGQYISMAMAYLPENFAIRQMRAEYKNPHCFTI